MTPEEQRAADVATLRLAVSRGATLLACSVLPQEVAVRILAALTTGEPWESLAATAEHCTALEMRVRELEAALNYSAECFHVAVHDLKQAPTWRACDRPTCRSALRVLTRADPSPTTDATPRQSQPEGAPVRD